MARAMLGFLAMMTVVKGVLLASLLAQV